MKPIIDGSFSCVNLISTHDVSISISGSVFNYFRKSLLDWVVFRIFRIPTFCISSRLRSACKPDKTEFSKNIFNLIVFSSILFLIKFIRPTALFFIQKHILELIHKPGYCYDSLFILTHMLIIGLKKSKNQNEFSCSWDLARSFNG